MPVFKLADLSSKYESRLQQLGCSASTRINSTRLKESILSQIPDVEAYKQGRDVFFAFRKDLGLVIQKSHDACDEDAIHLSKAASIVRKDMLAMKYNFDGSFDRNCQAESVPASLVSLVNMILYGPNIETQASNSSKAQAGLTISQLLQYNSYLRRRGDVVRVRRNKNRETPVSLYIGLSIHAKTRSRDLIDIMHDLGLCVSYDRVLAISTDIGSAVCRRYQEEQVVCPPNLRHDLFTLAAFDNIDHNPSSTTAHDSFHGTGISLFQHATSEAPGAARECIVIEKTETNTPCLHSPNRIRKYHQWMLNAVTFQSPKVLPHFNQTKMSLLEPWKKRKAGSKTSTTLSLRSKMLEMFHWMHLGQLTTPTKKIW